MPLPLFDPLPIPPRLRFSTLLHLPPLSPYLLQHEADPRISAQPLSRPLSHQKSIRIYFQRGRPPRERTFDQ